MESLGLDEYQYSNLAGDHILITRIEEFFKASGISSDSMFKDYSLLLKKLLLSKFTKGNSHITSFEIDMEASIEDSKFQKLVDKLSLAGTGIVFVLASLYIRSLFNSGGKFYLIAAAFTIVHSLCAVMTRGQLSLAWFYLLMSNLLWIVFSKIPYLHKRKYQNDIYHFMLIGSTYYLYSTIESGLWKNPIF